MNTSILVSSFKFQTKRFDLTVPLSTWVNDILINSKASTDILVKSFQKHDYDIATDLIDLEAVSKYKLKHKNGLLPTLLYYPDLISSMIDYEIKFNKTAVITEACKLGFISVIKTFVSRQCNFAKYCHSDILLVIATERKQTDIVKLIFEYHQIIDYARLLAICYNNNDLDTFEFLIQQIGYCKLFIDRNLLQIIGSNNLEVMSLMLRHIRYIPELCIYIDYCYTNGLYDMIQLILNNRKLKPIDII